MNAVFHKISSSIWVISPHEEKLPCLFLSVSRGLWDLNFLDQGLIPGDHGESAKS